MVTGPLLVVALSVASIASAAPIFDLEDFFYHDFYEDSKEEQAIKNVVIVNVSANSVFQNPNTPPITEIATTPVKNTETGTPPTSNGAAAASATAASATDSTK